MGCATSRQILSEPLQNQAKSVCSLLDTPKGSLVHQLPTELIRAIISNTKRLFRPALKESYEFKFSFGKQGQEDGEFSRPFAIAVGPDGSLFVADHDQHQIQVFTPKGEFLYRFGSGGSQPGSFLQPCAIAFSKEGKLVTLEYGNHRVQMFEPSGEFIRMFAAELLHYPNGLCVDNHGNVVVADFGHSRIQFFTTNGEWIKTVGGPIESKLLQDRRQKPKDQAKPAGCLDGPCGISFDMDDNLVVCDRGNHRIQVFDPEGNPIKMFGKQGSDAKEFSLPWGIFVDRNGKILVSDQCNNRMQVFDREGEYIMQLGSDLKYPKHLVVNEDGQIIVADESNHRIVVFG